MAIKPYRCIILILPYTIKLKGICDTVPGVAETAKEQQGFEFATMDPDDIINKRRDRRGERMYTQRLP